MRTDKRDTSGSKASPQKGATSNDVAPFLRVSAEWKGYVNVELSEREKSQFGAFSDDVDLVRENTAEVLSRGYKLSVVQVSADGTVKATAHAAFKGMPDSGYAVTAWQGSLFPAVAAVVFLVAFVARYDLSAYAREGDGKVRHTF